MRGVTLVQPDIEVKRLILVGQNKTRRTLRNVMGFYPLSRTVIDRRLVKSVLSHAWRSLHFTHVPFPKISSLVSGVVKHTRKILKILWILGEIIYNGMSVGVFT